MSKKENVNQSNYRNRKNKFNKPRENYHLDKSSQNRNITQTKIDKDAWVNFQRLLMRDLCTNTQIIDTGYIGDINVEDVYHALKCPANGWKILLDVSSQLMRISPHYYRLNKLYSNMALFCWGIDLYDVNPNANTDDIKNTYSVLATKLENMNLKHEFSKIANVLPYQDIFCGLVMENSNDFFIQQINFKICKLQQIQDGLYNFKIDLFKIKPQELLAYPNYIQEAWLNAKEGKTSNWYIPPANKQICIKLNSELIYPYPMLISLVKDIFDVDIYKKLKLQSARTDNYKAILNKIPIDSSTVDKPLLTPEILEIFAQMNRENMTDDIGILYTLGSDGEPISFKDSNNSRNNVSDSVDEIYNSSGITKELYNGSSSGTAVTHSIENNSGFIYGVYRQLERWVNRYIKLNKYNKRTFKFYFYLLDVTIFNRDNVSKRYKEACTLGATVVDKWLATLDMTPSRMLGSYIVHNEIFDYYNKFKPLSSSYNATANEAGRPTNADKGETLDVAGEKTADADSNIDR